MAEREGFEPSIRFKGVYSLSRRAPSTYSAISPRCVLKARQLRQAVNGAFPVTCNVAEGVGFEPTDVSVNGFQDRRLQPLGHPSEGKNTTIIRLRKSSAVFWGKRRQ
jgi:hypothetical protein